VGPGKKNFSSGREGKVPSGDEDDSRGFRDIIKGTRDLKGHKEGMSRGRKKDF